MRQAFHYCNTQIRLMENAWRVFNLDRYYNHPDNRGWMNLFNRWVRSDVFKMVWHINKSIYGKNFQVFCENHLPLAKTSESITVTLEKSLGENVIDEFKNILSKDQVEMLKNSSDEDEIWTIKNNMGYKGDHHFFVIGIALFKSADKIAEQ